MDGGEALGRLLPALVLVVVVPLVLRHFLRRSRVLGGEALHVVSRAPMGRSASAVILEAGDRLFLVGVTETSIRLISELDPEYQIEQTENEHEPGTDSPLDESNWPRIGLERWREMTVRRPPKERVRVLAD